MLRVWTTVWWGVLLLAGAALGVVTGHHDGGAWATGAIIAAALIALVALAQLHHLVYAAFHDGVADVLRSPDLRHLP